MAKKKNKKKPQTKPAVQTNRKAQDKGWNIALIVVGVLLLALLVFIVVRAAAQTPKTTNTDTTELTTDTDATQEAVEEDTAADDTSAEASSDFDTTVPYYADITVANYGTITVKLEPQVAPITVENFVNLANEGFYNGLTFHRIIEDFMIQGGDPLGDGTGGSDQTIKGEFSDNGVENPLSHTRGAISMARSSISNDSASSQFFIVHEDSTFLDGQYACFGYVTEGMDVVDAIAEDANPTDSNGTIPAEEQPVIESVVIRNE